MRGLKKGVAAAAATVGCLAAFGAGSASAATLSASNGAVTYTGAASEATHVSARFDLQYGVYVIEDTGAKGVSATQSAINQGCHVYSSTVAYCDFGSLTSLSIQLGNAGGFGQDLLTFTPVAITGGAGNDTLIGGGGADTLVAAGGNDTLTAGSGNTRLIAASGNATMVGGSGHNTYTGGPGIDTIRSRNGVTEDVTCGGGADSVTADTADQAAADCETINRGAATDLPDNGSGTETHPGTTPAFQPPLAAVSPAPVKLTAHHQVPVRVACPETAAGGCEGTIELTLPSGTPRGKVTAARRVKRKISKTKRFRIAAGEKAVVPVTLSRRGVRHFRRASRGRKALKVTVTVAMHSDIGTQKTTRTVTVQLERRARGSMKTRGRKR